MKKRIASILLVSMLCLSLLPTVALADETANTGEALGQMPSYSGGSGTKDDPWLIASVADLQTLATTINSGAAAAFDADCTDTGKGIPGNYHGYYFKQTTDLDLSSIDNWAPIGYSGSAYFAGHYDGSGYTIAHAKSTGKVDDEGFATAGIFGWVAFGSVSNLTVRDADFKASGVNNMSYAGGVLAVAYDCTVTNCAVYDSKIESERDPANSDYAGGICGIANGGFEQCLSVDNIIRNGSFGGGFVGGIDKGDTTFTNCGVSRCMVLGFSNTGSNSTLSGGFYGASMDGDAIMTNCFVFDCMSKADEGSRGYNGTGVFTANTQYGQVRATNCYYYDNNNMPVNAENAVAKTEEEFRDGTVAALLGSAFVKGKDGYPVFPVPATNIVLNKTAVAMKIGGEEVLTATLSPDNATDDVTWHSDAPDICEVSADGRVTAKAAGHAIITATAGGVSTSCNVTVAVPVTSLSLDKDTLRLAVSASDTLTASVLPEDATDKAIIWTSSDPAVATVDENGVVKAIAKGTTTITATAADDSDVEAACTVTVYKRHAGGSATQTPTNTITTPDKLENGAVTVSPKNAREGATVTVTVAPDRGFVLDTLTVTDKNGNKLTLTDKGDGTYTFTMPDSRVEVNATFVAKDTPHNTFVDVNSGTFYYDAVYWAVQKGITVGTDANHFSPEAPCTRAQIVTFLWRAAGSPVVDGTMNFSDVPADSCYADAIRWAVNAGITSGTSSTTFSPNDTCTRAQAVSFLCRAFNGKASGKASFSDVSADSYYADAVAWATENGVTGGIGGGLFGPDNDCTRAQIVTFLYRAYQGK